MSWSFFCLFRFNEQKLISLLTKKCLISQLKGTLHQLLLFMHSPPTKCYIQVHHPRDKQCRCDPGCRADMVQC